MIPQWPGNFATTHWSVVIRAADRETPEAASALEQLCSTYWYPLYAFVRRRGHRHEDACDLTQAFFARFIEKQYLRSVDSKLGKFRTFLLTSMTHFLANEWDKTQTQRRGGGRQVISLDAAAAEERYRLEPVDHSTPERIFERHWAQTLLRTALDKLAKETDEERFEVLKGFLIDQRGALSYEAASATLQISVAAVASAVRRMRERYRHLLYREVADTVETAEAVETELRHLLGVLSN
ncbi:MAG: sigma-70 family RNA polymerase sigma factor [Verrucomicrobiales bacterium]|nr:sigma-70 family RNA polymerase sigma factor [Verrucomicrobiales bacterium]